MQDASGSPIVIAPYDIRGKRGCSELIIEYARFNINFRIEENCLRVRVAKTTALDEVGCRNATAPGLYAQLIKFVDELIRAVSA